MYTIFPDMPGALSTLLHVGPVPGVFACRRAVVESGSRRMTQFTRVATWRLSQLDRLQINLPYVIPDL